MAKESVNNGPFSRSATRFVGSHLSRCGMQLVMVAVVLAMLLALAAIQQAVACACCCSAYFLLYAFATTIIIRVMYVVVWCSEKPQLQQRHHCQRHDIGMRTCAHALLKTRRGCLFCLAW